MRSCLIQLLVLIAMVFALLWFGLPLGADWLATNSLNASGFTGTGTKVDVSAYPPPVLLTGHAGLDPPDIQPGRYRRPLRRQHRSDSRQG